MPCRAPELEIHVEQRKILFCGKWEDGFHRLKMRCKFYLRRIISFVFFSSMLSHNPWAKTVPRNFINHWSTKWTTTGLFKNPIHFPAPALSPAVVGEISVSFWWGPWWQKLLWREFYSGLSVALPHVDGVKFGVTWRKESASSYSWAMLLRTYLTV